MSKAKYTALHEQTTCQEIKDIVIQMVEKAGGRIDYVEVTDKTQWFHSFWIHMWFVINRAETFLFIFKKATFYFSAYSTSPIYVV